MAIDDADDDLKPVLLEARRLAIDMKHGFIGIDHLFLALLKQNCLARKYLHTIEVAPLEKQVSDLYAATTALNLKSDIPLTVIAERTIQHAYTIAGTYDELTIDSIYLLLALLSFKSKIVKPTLDNAGILIEDITLDRFNKPIKKFPSPIEPIRNRRYSWIEKLLINIRGSKNEKIKALHKNALSVYSYYQFEETIKVCNAGLSLAPDNFDFKSLTAYSAHHLHINTSAIPIMQYLISSYPEKDNINRKITLAYMYDVVGEFHLAAEILDAELLRDPDNSTLLNNRGFNLAAQGKYAESIPYFEKALSIDSTMAFSYNNLGFSKFKLGETDEAISLVDKSLALNKGNSYAYKNKGIILMETGNKQEALKYFKLALKYGYTEKYSDEVSNILSTYNLVN